MITLGCFLCIFAYGLRAALCTKVTKVELSSDKIPHDLNIMLVSDLHVDDILSTVHLKELKKQIETQQPDVVLIAGDFFNRANPRQAEYFNTLTGLSVPLYAIEGNHDTMGNLKALERVSQLTNIHFLFNESVVLPERNLQLIGLKERGQRKRGEDDDGLSATLEESALQSGDFYNILLTHQPIGLRKLADFPVDLEVAGHTHKLQIRGLHFLSYLINDYTYGLYTGGSRNERHAFVSQGIGTR